MAKPIQNESRKVVYLPVDIAKALEEEAKENGMTFSGIVRMILIKRHNNNKK